MALNSYIQLEPTDKKDHCQWCAVYDQLFELQVLKIGPGDVTEETNTVAAICRGCADDIGEAHRVLVEETLGEVA